VLSGAKRRAQETSHTLEAMEATVSEGRLIREDQGNITEIKLDRFPAQRKKRRIESSSSYKTLYNDGQPPSNPTNSTPLNKSYSLSQFETHVNLYPLQPYLQTKENRTLTSINDQIRPRHEPRSCRMIAEDDRYELSDLLCTCESTDRGSGVPFFHPGLHLRGRGGGDHFRFDVALRVEGEVRRGESGDGR
jgi:hypothetical protein